MPVTYEILKKDEQVRAYIETGNNNLKVLGYTDHSFAHVSKTAETAATILIDLGFPEETAELARLAGFMHDIGNMYNRNLHALTGAELARSILERYDMPFDEIGMICSAIGNHDENTGYPVNIICAAVILADKSDVRRSRVQQNDMDLILSDIHDRVNYAVERADISVLKNELIPEIRLCLDIDTSFTPVMDYFEIFLARMLMCRRAASYLGADFELVINNMRIL
jgi:putative nucleotidyltransferase with HDIG domain